MGLLEDLKNLIAGVDNPVADPPPPVPAPAPIPAPEPGPVPAPAPVPADAPPPESPTPSPEILALQAQIAEQAEAMKVLAQRPQAGTPAPAPAKMPTVLDRKGLEERIEAELKDNEGLDYHWTEGNPISPPDSIVVGRGGPTLE